MTGTVKYNMRNHFTQLMYDEMIVNPRIVVIVGDLGFGVWDKIKDSYPDRFFNVGSAEMLMMGVAIGAALQDKTAVAFSITPFLLYRPFEMIRNYLNYENIPVKLVGAGRDKDYSHDGISHWAEDDMKILSAFKNILAYHPENEADMRSIFDEFLYSRQPTYLNLRRTI